MPRIPAVTREQIALEDRPYYDEIVGSRGAVRGPYPVLLHSPKLAARVAATGAYVRFEADLPDGLQEVVILATAAEVKAHYEFSAHASLAREAGVSEETIAAIAGGTAPAGLSEEEQLLVRYAQELLRNHKVGDSTFNAVKGRYGVRGTVELTVLIGHYLLVAQVLAAFDVVLAPGMASELPG